MKSKQNKMQQRTKKKIAEEKNINMICIAMGIMKIINQFIKLQMKLATQHKREKHIYVVKKNSSSVTCSEIVLRKRHKKLKQRVQELNIREEQRKPLNSRTNFNKDMGCKESSF